MAIYPSGTRLSSLYDGRTKLRTFIYLESTVTGGNKAYGNKFSIFFIPQWPQQYFEETISILQVYGFNSEGAVYFQEMPYNENEIRRIKHSFQLSQATAQSFSGSAPHCSPKRSDQTEYTRHTFTDSS